MRKGQGGPFLRIEEGDDTPVLCNHDELHGLEAACRQHPGMDDDTSRSAETEVVYSRDNVSVWPARKHGIPGRLRLVRQAGVLFLAWLPYSAGAAAGGQPPHEPAPPEAAAAPKGQYAVHPIPLSSLKALRKRTPKLGGHSVALVLRTGLTLPPFYFAGGGVRELLSVLKQHAVLTKSDASPGTYLVNDTEDPLQRSLATLELADVALPDAAEAGLQPAWGERLREGVARAAQLARDASSGLLLPPRAAAGPPGTAPAQQQQQQQQQQRAETALGAFELLDRAEPEGMGVGLAQPCPPPLSREEWFTFQDSQGRILDEKALRARVFAGGCEAGVRPEAWAYLLGQHPPGSTAAERQALAAAREAEYGRIRAQWESITEAQAARHGKWRERLSRVDKDVCRTDSSHPFFAGGLANPNVATLRRLLLTYSMFNFDLGYCQGMSDLAAPVLAVMRSEAPAFWAFAGLMQRAEGNFSRDSPAMSAQLAALGSLLRLADPPLHAFLVSRDCANFFFAYRWLLVRFKREFPFEQVLQLWEALWACPATPHLHLAMAAAILKQHRAEIMGGNMGLDELLGFCLRLAGNLDLGRTLRAAERLLQATGPAGLACLAAADLPC